MRADAHRNLRSGFGGFPRNRTHLLGFHITAAGFERLLQALATVPVVRQSEKRFEVGTSAWADVRLRDTTNLEPIEARIRIPETDGEPVVIQFGDQQYVVRVDAATLHTAKSGCAELGRQL
jgi:hypothetical protein